MNRVVVFLVVCYVSLLAALPPAAAEKTPEQLLQEAKAVITIVSVDDVKKMIDNKEKVILLDVRDKEEFEAGHLPGAINMSRGLLDFHVHEIIPDKNAKIVVH